MPPASYEVLICRASLFGLQRLAALIVLLSVSPDGLNDGEILFLRVAWQEVQRTLITESHHLSGRAVHGAWLFDGLGARSSPPKRVHLAPHSWRLIVLRIVVRVN